MDKTRSWWQKARTATILGVAAAWFVADQTIDRIGLCPRGFSLSGPELCPGTFEQAFAQLLPRLIFLAVCSAIAAYTVLCVGLAALLNGSLKQSLQEARVAALDMSWVMLGISMLALTL